MRNLSKAEMDAIEAQVNADGREIAARALHLANDSPDIAIAILGVAVGRIIDGIDEARRTETLRNFLESFEDTDA